MESSAAGSRRDLTLALAWAAALFAVTAWLGRVDLLDPDETRHAEVAREMLAAGRWLVPILHGEPYYQKPAAFYWLLAGSLRLFGEGAAAARVPSVAASLWTMFAAARFARRAYSPRVATFTVAGLGTTLAFVAVARTVVVDMAFTAALTSAFAWLGMWWLDAPPRSRAIWPFYVAIAVAVLIKGPAALVLAAMLVVALVITEQRVERHRSSMPLGRVAFELVRALKPLTGALIVLAIAAPWYVAAWSADPEYMRELLLHQNIERYLRPIGAGHVEPWYYYFIALPLGLLPWTPMIAGAIRARLARDRRTAADLYCALWAGVVLAFFLPASTKLLTYLLPAFPPLLCLAAAWAVEQHDAAAKRWLAPYAGAWTFVATLASVAACGYVLVHLRAGAATVVVLPLTVLSVAFAMRRVASPRVHLAVAAATSLALVAVVYGAVSLALNDFRDSRAGGALLRSGIAPDAEFVSYRCTPHAIAFYARKQAVRTRDPSRALRALGATPPGALLTERKRLAELGLDPLPPTVRVAWQNGAGLMLLLPTSRQERMAEKGGSRTLRRPLRPASRF